MVNKFGKRYISVEDLRSYATDLSIVSDKPAIGFLEFLERERLLTPTCRVELPRPILRRLEQEEHPECKVYPPKETDGPVLDAAVDLLQQLQDRKWARPDIYGEHVHPLDDVNEAHKPFIQKNLNDRKFTPWKELTTAIFMRNGYVIRSRKQFSPFFYHYWQIFWLATIIRSGVRVYYPLDDRRTEEAILSGDLAGERSFLSINFEAKKHLSELRQHAEHFDVVGRFIDNRQRVLQSFRRDRDPTSGRLSSSASRKFRSQERQLATQLCEDHGLSRDELIGFTKKQADWWSDTHRRGPEPVANEYKSNISASIELLRLACRVSGSQVVKLVGHRGGYSQPILKEIFPDWTEKQRQLTIRSLLGWLKSYGSKIHLFSGVTDKELEEFCNWIEEANLQQYYWHFQRLAGTNLLDGPVERASLASEIAGFANLCEMIVNESLKQRGETARGKTLGPKLQIIFGPHGPMNLTAELRKYSKLTRTDKQSLAQRLAQINRITIGGKEPVLLRTILSLSAIRNEGSHHGLLRYDRTRLFNMLEALAIASLAIWLCR